VPARDAAIRAPGLGGQRTFSPLAAVLGERITPELSYLQARFAGLVSYGLSADLLSEILPLGRALHATTVRRQVQVPTQPIKSTWPRSLPRFVPLSRVLLGDQGQPVFGGAPNW